jgi:hypothetical protein
MAATAAVGAGDTTPERMNRLLTTHLNDYTFQFRGTPVATLQATEMAQNLNNELGVTADSEGSGVWIDTRGTVTAAGRDYFTDLANGPFKWVIGGASPIKIRSYTESWEMIRIVNEAHMARTGGEEVVTFNVLSQQQFGRRTHTRLDLVNDDDAQVSFLAQRLVEFAGVDRQRLDSLVFIPIPNSETASMCSAAVFGDTALVTIDTIWGYSYQVPSQIFQIEHQVDAAKWTCTFRLDDTLFTGSYFAFNQEAFSDGFN